MSELPDLPVVIYTPASPLRDPAGLARTMLRDLAGSRQLAWRLFIRDVSAQYRQSIFGYLWALIPPLVASLPFIYLNDQEIVNMGDTPIPYAAYAIIGTIIWQVFVDALNAPLRTINMARSMLTRINLPREAILISALAQVLLGCLIRLALLGGVFAWFAIVPPVTALLFPLGIFSIILVGFVGGILLTPLGLLYHDIQQILPITTTFLMLLTPVVYPVPHQGLAATVAAFNPLTPLITTTRDWLTVGTSANIEAFTIITLTATVLLLTGWVVLRVAMLHLIARLGN